MRSKSIIILMFFMLCSLSCKSQKNTLENRLRECVNSRANNEFYKKGISSKEIDYYLIINDLEAYFIKENIFRKISKKEFLIGIDKIIKGEIDNQKLNDDILKIIDRYNFSVAHFSSTLLQYCPHQIFNNKEEMSKSFIDQLDAIDKLYAFDPYNQEYINELVNTVSEKDFKNIIYRAPIIAILYDLVMFHNRDNR